MASLVRWRYASAVAYASLDQRISHVAVTGIVTPTIAAQILRDNAAWLRRSGALAQVASYENAVLALNSEELLSSALRATPDGLDVPTSLHIAPHQYSLISAYSTLMAQHGIGRMPATSYGLALDWAQRQALVRYSMRLRRQDGSGSTASSTGAPGSDHPADLQTDAPSHEPQD